MKYLNKITMMIAVLAIIFSGFSWAFASDGNTIYACVNPNSGEIKIVNSPNECKKQWESLSWNKEGPPGPMGPPGVVDEAELQALKDRVSALESLLSHFSRDGNEIYISGANLHVVNGSGTTEYSENGLGNVIIGYNEEREDGPNIRSGSHNLILGMKNNYSSFGGVVIGMENEASSTHNFVFGLRNTASEDFASVTGGQWNVASGEWSNVSGGFSNIASGNFATVSGGQSVVCSEWYSWCAVGFHWP